MSKTRLSWIVIAINLAALTAFWSFYMLGAKAPSLIVAVAMSIVVITIVSTATFVLYHASAYFIAIITGQHSVWDNAYFKIVPFTFGLLVLLMIFLLAGSENDKFHFFGTVTFLLAIFLGLFGLVSCRVIIEDFLRFRETKTFDD